MIAICRFANLRQLRPEARSRDKNIAKFIENIAFCLARFLRIEVLYAKSAVEDVAGFVVFVRAALLQRGLGRFALFSR